MVVCFSSRLLTNDELKRLKGVPQQALGISSKKPTNSGSSDSAQKPAFARRNDIQRQIDQIRNKSQLTLNDRNVN